MISLALQAIQFRWKRSVLVPADYYDEVLVYETPAEVDGSEPNSMIHLRASDDRLTVIMDSSKEPIVAEMLKAIRGFLDVAIGWDGPFPG